jgi:aminoglycoside phosphotransferase
LSDDDAPKSAYEIILERLKKKDHDEGVEDRPVTDEQRARIAEVRKVYEARLAEREILYQSARRKAQDLETLDKLEEEYRRDRERIVSERDRKIDEARAG